MSRLHSCSVLLSFVMFLLLLVVFTLPGSAQAPHLETPQRIALLAEGNEAWRVGDILTATRLWEESIRLSRLESDAQTELNALARRGEALAAAGQLSEAADDLRAALDKARQVHQPVTVAALEGALGNLYFRSNDLNEASTWLVQSIAEGRDAGDNDVLAASENNMGNVVAASGAPGPAIDKYYTPAWKDAAGDKPLQATIAINMARTWLQQRDGPGAGSRRLRAKADASLFRAAELTRSLSPLSRDQVVGLMAVARIALPMARSEPRGMKVANLTFLERLSRQAMTIADALGGIREKSLTAGTLAEVLEEAGNQDEAAKWDRDAIRDAVTVDAKDLLWRWEWLNGRLAKKAGDWARAKDAYRRARETLEDIRMDLSIAYSNEGLPSFREEVGPLYFESVDLLLAEADGATTGGHTAMTLLRESVHVIEVFETAEVLNFFHRPCARIPDAPPGQPKGGVHEAILYPILRPDHIDLLLSLPDGTLIHRTKKIGQAPAERMVQRFRTALESDNADKRPAQQLYEWIIQPIHDDLTSQGVDTVVVVPDGTLRNIPFSALYDGDRRQYLIEQLAVVTEPSADLASRPDDLRPRRERVLLAGASTYTESGVSPLPGVTDELAAIEKLKPDATLLVNEDFTAEALRRKLQGTPFTTVHVAAHAVFQGSSETSYILTEKGKFSLDMLEASVKSSQFQDDPIALDLLVLSACKTASGNDQSALGLAGVAVKAGARSAIGALWEVSDPVAVDLMPTFYENLENPSTTKAKALQQAQLYLLHNTEYKDPFFWAPFLLIGNGG